MIAEIGIPDLASSTPLWLSLVTVFVNAVVGALRGYTDESRQWDIVGVSVFALLMGLGGGFIRDLLIGNLPAESLRRPWYLAIVAGAVIVVLLIGRQVARIQPVMVFLNAVAMGLFAVTGVAYAREFDLPFVSSVLIGTLSAVGGGMLVSVLQGHIPTVLLVGAPHALLAFWGSVTYAAVAIWNTAAASVAGIAVVIVAQYLVDHLGVRTRPAHRWRLPKVGG
ncbi:MAG: trimeric intracellular cation channel family protein [Ilumatobacteraceae bacterium]